MVRDPRWLYCYWEITPDTLAAAQRALGDEWGDHRIVLRVYGFPVDTDRAGAVAGREDDAYDIELPPDAASWYLHIGRTRRTYRVAYGFLTRSGRFHSCALSNAVATPRDSVDEAGEEHWAHQDELLARLSGMLEGGLAPGSSAALGLPPYKRPAPGSPGPARGQKG